MAFKITSELVTKEVMTRVLSGMASSGKGQPSVQVSAKKSTAGIQQRR